MRGATTGRRVGATVAFATVVLLSAYVLFAPTSAGPSPFPGADKVVHAVLFAALAATARVRFGGRLPVAGLLVGYAVLSEVVQAVALPTRSGDALDVLADLAGAALGWLVVARTRAVSGGR